LLRILHTETHVIHMLWGITILRPHALDNILTNYEGTHSFNSAKADLAAEMLFTPLRSCCCTMLLSPPLS
jgi:hypothetical protein